MLKSWIIILWVVLEASLLTACNGSSEEEDSPNLDDDTDTKADCDYPLDEEDLCVSMEWIQEPNSDDYGSFTLSFWENSGSESEGPFVSPENDFEVELWMPSMGHGSSAVTVTKESAGVYTISDVAFSMAGEWEIRVKLQDESGETLEQAKIPYDSD